MECQNLLFCGDLTENKAETKGLVLMVNTLPGQGDEHQEEKQWTNDFLSFDFAMFIETDSYSIAQAAPGTHYCN